MKTTAILLVVVALGLGMFAFMASSQATSGPSGVAFACLLAIVARMCQASAHESARIAREELAVAKRGLAERV